MYEMMNPVNIIQWIFAFAKGVVDFMETTITIPGMDSAPVWSLFAALLVPLLAYLIIKRLIT